METPTPFLRLAPARVGIIIGVLAMLFEHQHQPSWVDTEEAVHRSWGHHGAWDGWQGG